MVCKSVLFPGGPRVAMVTCIAWMFVEARAGHGFFPLYFLAALFFSYLSWCSFLEAPGMGSIVGERSVKTVPSLSIARTVSAGVSSFRKSTGEDTKWPNSEQLMSHQTV
ncbi:uncharacterized protein BO87DRAFT_49391 [Aspergillus neoniger CBS 115656]|uniref:Uncharacterized protein n=1 Tax=Aspergillus neoniger (strain CBS 115656) TaxID=1448310 RepID=A0A318YJ91_ASPNB|nr:hypothetical protein BO87DRAFT_49391 [Aspergillus neoniger CBS 115656]PYH34525.1 hypothetical protein BO87DRAFT_49391 [Aspergillus neoniger CBS 115656]